MSFTILADGTNIPVDSFFQDDGSSSFKMVIPPGFMPKRNVMITIDTKTPVDRYLWEITLARQAVLTHFVRITDTRLPFNFILHLPYLPYAKNHDTSALDAFFSIIKGWFDEIALVDPHSDYLLRNYPADSWVFTIKPQYACATHVIGAIEPHSVLIAMDERHSFNKVRAMVDYYQGKEQPLQAVAIKRNKHDPKDFTIDNADFYGKRCIIMQDIGNKDEIDNYIKVDGMLREKGANRVDLYITHDLLGAERNRIKGIINNLYTYQTIGYCSM